MSFRNGLSGVRQPPGERRRNMKRISFLLLMVFSLCAAAYADDSKVSDQERLLDLLTRSSGGEIEFDCSGDFFSFLEKDHFRELYRILFKAGIDQDTVQVSYNSAFRHISLSSVRFVNLPWAECFSREDARQAILSLSERGSDIALLCTDSLLSSLTEGPWLEIYAAQAGIETYSGFSGQTSGILRLTNIRRFSRPYASAADYAQFASAVSEFKQQGVRDFYIVFDPDLLQKVLNDEAEKTIMFGSSRIAAYNGSYSPSSGVFHFSEVEYTDDPREICRTSEDVTGAIRRMGAAKIRSFELIFPYREVFEKLAANDFYLLEKLKAEAGMSGADISYSRENCRIYFKNAVIDVNAVALSELKEAVDYTERQILEGAEDIHLFCTEALFRALMGDGRDDRERIYDLISNAGITDYDLFYSDISHVINIHVNKLYPGTAIILAERSGNTASLTAREKQTRDAAARVAAAARGSDPLMTAKYIHDWLCENVVYYIDETSEEDDNAIGAILNGKANCDGYADAFYLIGTLAGLEVRYQHGYSIEKNIQNSRAEVGHMWNLLKISGAWRMVDVTWDDEEDGFTHVWFNVGRDIAKRMHYWNEDMSVTVAPFTFRTVMSEKEFYISDLNDIRAAVDQAARMKLSDFYILFNDPVHPEWFETAKTLVSERCRNSTLTFSWNEKMFLGGFYGVIW